MSSIATDGRGSIGCMLSTTSNFGRVVLSVLLVAFGCYSGCASRRPLDAGGASRGPILPSGAAVGSGDGVASSKALPEADVSRGPFPTITEMCAANDRVMLPRLREQFCEDAFPYDIGFGAGVRCRRTKPPKLSTGQRIVAGQGLACQSDRRKVQIRSLSP